MTTKNLMDNILTNLGTHATLRGVKYNLKDGKFHSENDEPAFETHTGIKAWFKNGKLHRDTKDPETGMTLPAFIKQGSSSEVLMEWWCEDQQHRDDIDPKTKRTLPAEIFIFGESSYKCWRKNGTIHRDSNEGPAYINRYCETYMEDGVPHREGDLPAILSSDKREMEWWVRGKRHRDTRDVHTNNLLPAVLRLNGDEEFWVNGVRIS